MGDSGRRGWGLRWEPSLVALSSGGVRREILRGAPRASSLEIRSTRLSSASTRVVYLSAAAGFSESADAVCGFIGRRKKL